MRKAAVAGGILAVLVAGVAAVPDRVDNEEAAVRQAVDHYLQAHATGQGDHARVLFHPESKLFWVAGDTLSQRTGEAYVAGFRGRPQADESARRRWISSVDVTGTAAVARVVLDYPNALFTDYLSLLKIGGEWKVVNKIFHVEPKGG